jgi:hypothetical protein
MADLGTLAELLEKLQGGSPEADKALSQALNCAEGPITESVEEASRLVHSTLPDWHVHVGYDASGILPYASLTLGAAHYEAIAPTVPLALVRVLVAALRGIAQEATQAP